MDKKEHRLWIRVTEREMKQIKEKSIPFRSVASYIRTALSEFSNLDAKTKLDNINSLSDLLHTYQNELSSIAGNLNQAMKRINELNVAGMLMSHTINNELLPHLKSVHSLCMQIKSELDKNFKSIRR